MPMNNRLLRPFGAAVAALLAYILTTIAGDTLTDQTGDPLRTIQDA